MAKPPEVLLTPADAARVLGMTPENVRRLTRLGVLTPAAVTENPHRPMALYRRADVEALAAKRARPHRRPSGRPPGRRTTPSADAEGGRK
jgi:hypothetical protein